jgi:hypothetical protein
VTWQERWKLHPHGDPDHITDILDRGSGDRVGYAVKNYATWTVTVLGPRNAHQFTASTRREALVGMHAALTALETS